jgi:hypothetical protein
VLANERPEVWQALLDDVVARYGPEGAETGLLDSEMDIRAGRSRRGSHLGDGFFRLLQVAVVVAAPGFYLAVHPSANPTAPQICSIRAVLNCATRFPSLLRDMVTTLCRFTAQAAFIPSFSSSTTFDGTPRTWR